MSFAQQAGANIKFENTPSDTISCIAVNNNPSQQLVCCSSWNNSITLWQLVNAMGNNVPQPRNLISIPNPTHDAMLCCTFKDNDILVGTASGKVCQIMFEKTDVGVVGSHAGIISGIRWLPKENLLCTGSSYDYKLNFWDLRDSTKPANSFDLSGKCKCLDAANEKAVIVTSDNKIQHYDTKAHKILKTFSNKIQCPITSIAISNDGNGYVAGGQNGIVEANLSGSGADLIPCHRENSQTQGVVEVYASNCIALSNIQQKNVIISGGGNGTLEYINAETLAKTYTKKMNTKGDPVTACAIIPKSKIYLVATGNDWAGGADSVKTTFQPEMTIRMFSQKEITG